MVWPSTNFILAYIPYHGNEYNDDEKTKTKNEE
jgi:hypothetical protein